MRRRCASSGAWGLRQARAKAELWPRENFGRVETERFRRHGQARHGPILGGENGARFV